MTSVPFDWRRYGYSENEFLQRVLIFEITPESGPCKTSLKEFKKDRVIRTVYYDATPSEMAPKRNMLF